MPRRKEIKIPAKKLDCYKIIVTELSSYEEFTGYDFSTLLLSVKAVSPPPRILEDNLNKAIKNLERKIVLTKDPFDFLVGKQNLAKILGVSRPTLDRWCHDELITSDIESIHFRSEQSDLYDLAVVLRQLKAIQAK